MIGIIADDITGANDIGIMYAKHDWPTDVYPYPFEYSFDKGALPDALIIDTNSRLDSGQTAYEKVFNSVKTLDSIGCDQFFNKTCSVFRGNIGAEFDAMLDALSSEFAIVVLGFPKNGRTTMHGHHYVHGKKLEESEFYSDPVHPMKRSDLAGILQSQTNRTVDSLDIDVIEQGSEKIKEAIESKREHCNYLILDVKDQSSLKAIAVAIKTEKIICGASGIAEELACVQRQQSSHGRDLSIPPSSTGVLCAAGSLMPQTYNQIKEIQKRQVPVVEMKSLLLFSPEKEEHLKDVIEQTITTLRSGADVLVYSSNEPAIVKETKSRGREFGYTNTQISRLVSETLAFVVSEVVRKSGVNRLLLAGGETSASICKKIGIKGLSVWKEIEPGLPSCISLDPHARKLVLKSGSFGSDDFFVKAIQHLKE
ncbi:four-carbon acid sugar kinase family protein [Fictibacillus terranigra]|uniref:Four-carbon acid sugar kinase family protein n=1 Tax=Fictibacillus terranigra TaxID=3058424 RepID=A0ABT8E507_9BACL|nr:four-carbon acid sugar kinase family protein [Fictibacillus sp. CENA-BCM004]MDN4072997.1 four-carbon acid sugar kinase family protein [Fictibacillus sp. CENA-BCM004]